MIDRGKAARRILPTSPVSEFVFINILAAICIRRMRICGLSNARLVQSTFVTDCVQFPNSVVAHNAVGASTHTGELHTGVTLHHPQVHRGAHSVTDTDQ